MRRLCVSVIVLAVLVSGTILGLGPAPAANVSEVLIGARVHASFRMNLTVGLVVVLGLHIAAEIDRRRSLH